MINMIGYDQRKKSKIMKKIYYLNEIKINIFININKAKVIFQEIKSDKLLRILFKYYFEIANNIINLV
jgi:hypothetical protein